MDEKNYSKNEPVWFNKSPVRIESPANASFVRDLGEVNSESVCEITYQQHKWIVRYSEIKTEQDALTELAKSWNSEIEDVRHSCKFKKDIAYRLKICATTLRKRLKFIAENLPAKAKT